MHFLIPREPQLTWSMLFSQYPGPHVNSLLHAKDMACFFWARNALYHGLKALQISPGDNILLPSYLCAAAVEPLLSYGVTVQFYDIDQHCSPNFADLHAKIDHHTRAVMAVHYFGFPQPMSYFKDLCTTYNLYLIEDCAHVLQGESNGAPLGSWGDISIYSWRKFLPLYDGGQLVINNPTLHVDIPWQKESLFFRVKVTKNLLERLFEDSAHPLAKTVSALLHLPQGMMRSLVSSLGKRQTTVFTTDTTSVDFNLSLVNAPMSSLSRHLLCRANVPAIVQQRRHNYTILLNAIQAFPEVTAFFPTLPQGVCPLAFPLLVPERADFHLHLRARGIPASTWGGVIHPIFPRAEFPIADYLYRNLISLPVHQSLNDTDMQTIITVLAKALR